MFREYNTDNQYIQFVAWDSCNKCKKQSVALKNWPSYFLGIYCLHHTIDLN
jgi:hypothetical protein